MKAIVGRLIVQALEALVRSLGPVILTEIQAKGPEWLAQIQAFLAKKLAPAPAGTPAGAPDPTKPGVAA